MRFPVFGAVFSTAATIATIASGLSAPASAQEVTLRLHTFLAPVANPPKTFLIPWIQKVEKASNGKLKVQPFWAMQLGGREVQLLDQVRDGVVDIAWTLPGFTPGRMPRVEPFELPFVHKDPVSSALALQDYQAKHLGPDLADYHPLVLNTHAGFLLQTKDPILKMSDLKGKKIRGASRASVWLLEAIGATGVGLPLNELPQALSTGVIDGSLLPFEIAPAVKMQDLVSHFSELSGPQPRLGTNVFTFLMNKQSYSKLSAELKKVIDDNSGRKLAPFAIQVWDMIDADGLKVMQSKPKNKFVTLSAAETEKYRKLVQPVFARFKAEVDKSGADGAKVIADAEALVAKYAK
jgi:TRAP-type C4-dicarboxylate transport system substrate-binding protein